MLSTIRRPLSVVIFGLIANQKNYLIKEGKAYTEDGILIFNIFFECKKMTEQEVHEYFTYFGEVKSVNYEDHTNGFVNFADASSAARALQTVDGTQKERRVYVRAADSWNQPNGSEKCCPDDCYTSDDPSCSADHKHLNILPLPDYCLEEICRKLKLSDQIHFARVCPRFYDVFQMYSKRAYRSFNCEVMDSMTQFEATYFIRFVGVHIETLKVRSRYMPNIIEKNIVDFCVNVKRLNCEESDMSRSRLEKILRNLNNLQELNLGYVSNLRGADIEVLYKVPSLKIINLSGISITGEIGIIKNMPQLVGLIFYDCSEFKISYLLDILKSLKRLKLLDIREIFSENEYLRVLNTILDYGKELEELKMTYYDIISYESLALLPKLKSLQLENAEEDFFDDSDCTHLLTLLENLVVYKSNQLEELTVPHIDSYNLAEECCEAISQLRELKRLDLSCSKSINDDAVRKLCKLEKLQKIALNSSNITNKGVVELLNNCKNLLYIDLTFCHKIDTDFITEAIKILEERRDILKKPVVFYLFLSSISEAAVADMPDYKTAAEAGLIKVDFDDTSNGMDFTNEFGEV